ETSPPTAGSQGPLAAVLAHLPGLERWADAGPIAVLRTRLHEQVASRWERATPRRRRVLVAALAGAAAALLLALALPAGPSDGSGVAPTGGSTAAGEERTAAAPVEGSSAEREEGDESRVPATTGAPADPSSAGPTRGFGSTDARVGDDPVAAASELARLRAGCFAQLSLECLAGVDQTGSPAESADRAALAALQRGEQPDPAPVELPTRATARLLDDLGGAAVVGLGGEVDAPSVLVIRVDGQWRLRAITPAG
ncbi:MAG: hypothetical protein J0G30_13860, partial [Actinomycetales bacterium]|nr:hypothetical protein [Actinomycetales bacterium]